MRGRLILAVLWLLGAAGAPVIARAQEPEPARPQAAGRVVKAFDFEEKGINPGEVPLNWYRAQDDPRGARRPGFPPWNMAKLSYDDASAPAFEGSGSVYLPTKGGSTSLILAPGVIPVFEGTDYRVSAMVRVDSMENARACVMARLLDRSGATIRGSEARVFSEAADTAWHEVHADILGKFEGAAWMQLELAVLQPSEATPGRTPANYELVRQDYTGAARFDEVRVTQLPRLELRSNSPINVIWSPQTPRLTLNIRDLTGEQLIADVCLSDAGGAVVHRQSVAIGSGSQSQEIETPVLAFGWYRAEVRLRSESGELASTAISFVYADRGSTLGGDPDGSGDQHRLFLTLEAFPEVELELVPDLAAALGVGEVTMPVWGAACRPEDVPRRIERLDPVLVELAHRWIDTTMSLDRVPIDMVRPLALESSDVWRTLSRPSSEWISRVRPFIDAFAQSNTRWLIGAPQDDEAFGRASEPEILAVRRELGDQGALPPIVLPTAAEHEWDASRLDGRGVSLMTLLNDSLTPEGVYYAVRAWAEQAGKLRNPPQNMFVLDRVVDREIGARAAAAELARRMVEVWNAVSTLPPGEQEHVHLGIRQPWSLSQDRRPVVMPTASFAAWRSCAAHLNGRRVVGSLPAGDGIMCYILAPIDQRSPGQHGALVAWCSERSSATLEAMLGSGDVRVIDLFGNTTPARHAADSDRVYSVDLTTEPVFVENVDVDLVRLLSGVRLEPGSLVSTNLPQDMKIVLSNTFGTGITGRVTVLEPGGTGEGPSDRTWRISPRSQPFAIPAGKTAELPLSVTMGSTPESSEQAFVLDLELTADRSYGVLQIRRMVEVGMPGVSVDLQTPTVYPNGDLGVDVTVVNTGTHSLSLTMTAIAPNSPRQKDVVFELAPGKQRYRRFMFPGAGRALHAERVTVTITDPETKQRLTRSVVVP